MFVADSLAEAVERSVSEITGFCMLCLFCKYLMNPLVDQSLHLSCVLHCLHMTDTF